MSDGSIPDSSAYVYVDRNTTDKSDSLNYDNGSVRYNYDVAKGGPHEDVSGQGGLGYTTEDTDVYVSGHFDEATGKVGGRVDLEHAISPDTVFDSHFAIDNNENTDGHVGLTHLIDDGKAVRGELGFNEAEGDYIDAQYESQFEGGSDSLKFRGSEKGGSSIEYNGVRSGDDWDLGLNLKADDEGKLTGNLTGEKRFELDKDTSGRVYGNTDLEGNWKAGGDVTRVLGDDAGVQAGIEFDHEGRANGFVTHVHGENHESVGIQVNEKGEESYSYSGHHVSGALTTDESMTIDKDGKVDGQIAATYEDAISDTRTRVYNGTIRADGSWKAGINQYDKVSENIETHNGVALDSDGKLSGEHNVLVTTLEGNGYVGAGVGWDDGAGEGVAVGRGVAPAIGASVMYRLLNVVRTPISPSRSSTTPSSSRPPACKRTRRRRAGEPSSLGRWRRRRQAPRSSKRVNLRQRGRHHPAQRRSWPWAARRVRARELHDLGPRTTRSLVRDYGIPVLKEHK